MGILDRILGIDSPVARHESGTQPAARTARPQVQRPMNTDEQALERYRYMLKTAPPETLEEAHAEAFSRLSPEQRKMALAELANAAPANERAAAQAVSPEDSRAMGRLATRQEMRQPGFMERTFGGGGGGLGGSLLASFAMGFVGSMVASTFFSAIESMGDGQEVDAAGGTGADVDQTQDPGAESASNDDLGTGDDFGGGDLGGGDF